MKEKKLLFLILALVLPVAIFIFLKIFGRNEFNVPVMHQEGKVEAPENCHYNYPTPYVVPDSISTFLKSGGADSLYVIYFEPSLRVPLKRVSVAFGYAFVKIISPSDLSGLKTDIGVLKECIFLMKPPLSIVLIDKQNRIRGYYDGSDRDEMDRLIVEINVILKRY